MRKCNGQTCRCNPHLELAEVRRVYFLGIKLFDVKVFKPAPSQTQAVRAEIKFGTKEKREI